MPFQADCHIHSMFSGDSESLPEETVHAALGKGLDKIIFTDHCECDGEKAFPPGIPAWEPFELANYVKYIETVRTRFSEAPIEIGTGLELGSAVHNKPFAEKVLSFYDWDFIIGSNHIVRGQYDFYYLNYREIDTEKIFRQYFEELYELAQDDNFDVLGHLYYFVRYAHRQGVEVHLEKYRADIAQIYKEIIQNGKGIEVNTSHIDREYGKAIPDLEYVRLFRECGGEIVTVGSDAHTSEAVGRGQKEALEILREAGFKAVASFTRRKPVFKDI